MKYLEDNLILTDQSKLVMRVLGLGEVSGLLIVSLWLFSDGINDLKASLWGSSLTLLTDWAVLFIWQIIFKAQQTEKTHQAVSFSTVAEVNLMHCF